MSLHDLRYCLAVDGPVLEGTNSYKLLMVLEILFYEEKFVFIFYL